MAISAIMAMTVALTAFTWYAPFPTNPKNHTWHGAVVFGITIGLAVLVSMVIAAFSGTAAPLIAKRLGFDPSAMSGPMETAFQDIVGSTFLLAVAAGLLRKFGESQLSECPGGSGAACIELCRVAAHNATAALFNPGCIEQCLAFISEGAC